jgi:hypothetical protein
VDRCEWDVFAVQLNRAPFERHDTGVAGEHGDDARTRRRAPVAFVVDKQGRGSSGLPPVTQLRVKLTCAGRMDTELFPSTNSTSFSNRGRA